MFYRILTIGLFSVLLLVNTGKTQQRLPATIDELAQNYVKKRKNNALVIGIIQGEQSVVRGFGQLDRKDSKEPEANTIFAIGAMSSVLTTTAAFHEAEHGTFHPDDPIAPHLEKVTNVPSFQAKRCVEIRLPGQRPIVRCTTDPLAEEVCINFCHLANHTSGLACSGGCWYVWNPFVEIRYEPEEYYDPSKESLYFGLANFDLKAPPGYEFRYSNLGISILGNLTADLAGISFDSLIDKHITQPLHMENTCLQLTSSQKQVLAPGHDDRGKLSQNWEFEGMAPAAGFYSTATDLLRFLQANMYPKDDERQKVYEVVQQGRLDVDFPGWDRSTQVGYGWLISLLSEESNLPVHWINGGTLGYRGFMGFTKDTGKGVVILSNSAEPVDAIGWEALMVLNGF